MTTVVPTSSASATSADGMTFLQICQRLRQEGRGSGSGPVTVVGQTGDMKSIVDWAAAAYRRIQTSRRNWRWLWTEVAIPVSAFQRDYSLAQIAVLVPTFTRFSNWKRNGFKYYVTSEGVAGERKLAERLYERSYEAEFGTVPSSIRPNHITVLPDGSLRMGQTPTENGVLTAIFYRKSQTLVLDADTPEMPTEFHELIVWKALVDFGIVEAASEIYERAVMNCAEMYPQLMNDQLEPVELYSTTMVE